MAVSIRTDFDYSGGSATQHNITNVVTQAGDFLVVRIASALGTAPVVSSVVIDPTGANVALTQRTTKLGTTGNPLAEIWDLDAASMPSPGTYTVRITLAAAKALVANAALLTGVHTVTPRGTIPAGVNGTSTSPSITVSSETDGLVLDAICVASGSSATATAGAGQTEQHNAQPTTGLRGAFSTEPGAASVAMSWTISGASWGLVAVPYNPAPATGITGTASFTLPALTITSAGAVRVAAAAALTLPKPTPSSTALVRVAGAGGFSLPLLQLAATSGILVHGVSTITLPALGAAAAARVLVQGSAAIALPSLAFSGATLVRVQASAGLTLPLLVVTGTNVEARIGSAAITLPIVTMFGGYFTFTHVFSLSPLLDAALSVEPLLQADFAITPLFEGSFTVAEE